MVYREYQCEIIQINDGPLMLDAGNPKTKGKDCILKTCVEVGADGYVLPHTATVYLDDTDVSDFIVKGAARMSTRMYDPWGSLMQVEFKGHGIFLFYAQDEVLPWEAVWACVKRNGVDNSGADVAEMKRAVRAIPKWLGTEDCVVML